MTFPRPNKGFITLGTLLTMTFCAPFVAQNLMTALTLDSIHSESTAPAAETVIVLGAAAYPARLSEVLQDRMDTALDLYQSGKAKNLFLTGAPNEVEKMAEYALEKGAKADDLIQDPEGLNTAASMRNAAKSVKSALVVTQSFHLPRALVLARHFGIRAEGVSADRRAYPKMFEFRKRELLASSKAMLDILFPSFAPLSVD